MPFDLHSFIVESNLIDPQPGVPGMVPGDRLYDNQVNAFNLAKKMAEEGALTKQIALNLHRELTRNVPFFEDQGMSGRYRQCNVWIAGEQGAPPYLVPVLMEELWFPMVEKTLEAVKNKKMDATEGAWWTHHCFEVIHPFVDGNGRTGRLLLNWFLMACGEEPIVVKYSNRWGYYQSIQDYRKLRYPTLMNEFSRSRGDKF